MLNPLAFLRPRRPLPPDAFSPDEVLEILRGRDHSERAQEALDLIATPTAWLPADSRRAFGRLAWYAERLPTILNLYRRGWATEQIGRRLSPLGGAWAVERTLERAADLIAERINARLVAA